MDWKTIINIVFVVISIVLYLASEYYKRSSVLREFIAKLIADAERNFADKKKAGREKMDWVLDELYARIPLPLKPFFSRSDLENVVQTIFDQIAAFADIQIKKLQKKYEEKQKS